MCVCTYMQLSIRDRCVCVRQIYGFGKLSSVLECKLDVVKWIQKKISVFAVLEIWQPYKICTGRFLGVLEKASFHSCYANSCGMCKLFPSANESAGHPLATGQEKCYFVISCLNDVCTKLLRKPVLSWCCQSSRLSAGTL